MFKNKMLMLATSYIDRHTKNIMDEKSIWDNILWLADFDAGTILDSDNTLYPFAGIGDRLRTLIRSAQDIRDYKNYWDELPESNKTVVASTLQSYKDALVDTVAGHTEKEWLLANYETRFSQLRSWGDALYPDFIRGIREFKNAQDITREQVQASLKELQKATREVSQTRKILGEVTTEASANALHEYFDELVTGEKYRGYVTKKRRWYNLFRYFNFRRWRCRWEFFTNGKRGYEASARKWLVLLVLSIAATSYLAHRSFVGIQLEKVTLNEVIARAFLIAAPAYAIRFCVRNFNAAKHHATLSRHKAMVLKTMQAIVAREEVSGEVKEQVIVESVKSVFDPGESGYITRRDGAGSSDNFFDIPSVKV